jgi:hypothetical protein
MHKRNVTLIALVLAAITTLLVEFVPPLRHSEWVGLLHFPAIVLAVALSGGSHSPSAAAGWTAFIAYAGTYCILFVVSYALVLEAALLHGALRRLDRMADEPDSMQEDPHVHLQHLGQALGELEARRRRHWVLQDMEGLDLAQDPESLARAAVQCHRDHRVVRRSLARMQRNLTTKLGPQRAAAAMSRLLDRAHGAADGATA